MTGRKAVGLGLSLRSGMGMGIGWLEWKSHGHGWEWRLEMVVVSECMLRLKRRVEDGSEKWGLKNRERKTQRLIEGSK